MVNIILKNLFSGLEKKASVPLNLHGNVWLKTAEDCYLHVSRLYIFSYIWRHLDIGYVQGMCDLLAPLLVILDDGESTVWITSYFLSSLTFGVLFFFTAIDRTVCSLTFSLLAEAMAFSCFTELMKRMNQNFPHGGAMDTHFANMRSLIQVKSSHILHQLWDTTKVH